MKSNSERIKEIKETYHNMKIEWHDLGDQIINERLDDDQIETFIDGLSHINSMSKLINMYIGSKETINSDNICVVEYMLEGMVALIWELDRLLNK